jgi:acyl-CoA synthetase (AMP-forming)/AMP-acid ligase II
MQNMPLMISSLIRHADRNHGDTEIVSRETTGGLHRYTYRDAHRRARQLARALSRLASSRPTAWRPWPGTTTATSSCTTASPAWGHPHTINPRLFPEQIAYIVNHADDVPGASST